MSKNNDILKQKWQEAKELKERLFYLIADSMYESALAIQNGTIQATPREKENSALSSTILTLNTGLAKSHYDVTHDINIFTGEEKVSSPGIEAKLTEALMMDGAIVIEDRKVITNGAFYDTKPKAKRQYSVKDFAKLERMFLPINTCLIGMRTKTALSTALLSENPESRVYCLTSTTYTNAGTGRLLMLSPAGTLREFYITLDSDEKLLGSFTRYKFNATEKQMTPLKQERIKLS